MRRWEEEREGGEQGIVQEGKMPEKDHSAKMAELHRKEQLGEGQPSRRTL